MKKIILSCLFLFFALSLGIFVHKSFEKQPVLASVPQAVQTYEMDEVKATPKSLRSVSNEEKIYQQIDANLLEGTNIVLFYKPNDDNSIYFLENLILPLFDKENIAHDTIKYIDLSVLDDNYLPTNMKKNWGFSTYPALLEIEFKQGETYDVKNVLEFDSNKILTNDELKKWFIDRGIIKINTENQGELIEKPIE